MIVVGIIVFIVIAFQVSFFWKNLKRMHTFRDIFSAPSSWAVQINEDGQTVSGINGEGNSVFKLIKDNINDYLGNSQGSVIDYNILKDAVDRNCETIEDEINAQMPVPLYCGLAGTMAGVIVGLFSLLSEDSISNLMTSGSKSVESATLAMNGAASGINDLLAGVALAMVASILGIVLTTVNSVLFKQFKRQEEEGKNKFLSWVQSILLPELPNDISDSFSMFVDNLNRFNDTFRENTRGLGHTLEQINGAYSTQADIIKTIQQMNVTRMATANVKVLNALSDCTDKLEQFNVYLNSIQGYTNEIEAFRQQLSSEANMVYLLMEMKDTLASIKNFFKTELGEIDQRKQAIGKSVDNVDEYVKRALERLKTSSSTSVDELKKAIDDHAQGLQTFLDQEKQMLQDMSQEVRNEFDRQISQIPNLAKRLEDITKVPSQLESLSGSIAESNRKLVNGITQANQNMTNEIKHALKSLDYSSSGKGGGSAKIFIPMWMKVAVIALLTIIAGASVANSWISYSAANVSDSQEQMGGNMVVQSDSVAKKDTLVANSATKENTASDSASAQKQDINEEAERVFLLDELFRLDDEPVLYHACALCPCHSALAQEDGSDGTAIGRH